MSLTISESKPFYIVNRPSGIEPTMTVLLGEAVVVAFYFEEQILIENDRPVAVRGSLLSDDTKIELIGREEAVSFSESILTVLNEGEDTMFTCEVLTLEEATKFYFIKAGGIGDEWSICDRQAYYAHFGESDPSEKSGEVYEYAL